MERYIRRDRHRHTVCKVTELQSSASRPCTAAAYRVEEGQNDEAHKFRGKQGLTAIEQLTLTEIDFC